MQHSLHSFLQPYLTLCLLIHWQFGIFTTNKPQLAGLLVLLVVNWTSIIATEALVHFIRCHHQLQTTTALEQPHSSWPSLPDP